MNREKYLPLTETTYYILLALAQPGHGYHVMQKVEELSGGTVRIAAGTMYGALDTLLKNGWIQALPSADPRRKLYVLSPLGSHVLQQDAQRMRHMVALAGLAGQ